MAEISQELGIDHLQDSWHPSVTNQAAQDSEHVRAASGSSDGLLIHIPSFCRHHQMEKLQGLTRQTPQNLATCLTSKWSVSSDIRFWSSGDTKTGPPDGLLMGA
ncbi:MAG: hypothetical protein AAFX65_11180, partial [Cyanobacteria bacterium J06638_7]